MINDRDTLKTVKVRAKRISFRQTPELSKILDITFHYINNPTQAFPEKKVIIYYN